MNHDDMRAKFVFLNFDISSDTSLYVEATCSCLNCGTAFTVGVIDGEDSEAVCPHGCVGSYMVHVAIATPAPKEYRR